MADRYEPSTFEGKWRQRWKKANLFKTRDVEGAPKFYGLDFFPYPSGAGLSVGHARNFVPTDVICRMKLMQGFNVLHPMGFDAFGLPAENEAIKRQTHPAPMIRAYADRYHDQMDLIGISYDWDRSFSSSDPTYYKWTQWIFELLYKRGLAYRKMASVNWCPKDKTALANEEVIAGYCERCGTAVEKRNIPQWFFKITEYAERLIDDLDTINWPDGIKMLQKNWIGKSEGVQFSMAVASAPDASSTDGDLQIKSAKKTLTFDVFTTRIDTIFGMTFCVLAPEHAVVEYLAAMTDDEHREAIRSYQESAKRLSDADRQATTREKTGVHTGCFAINPANGAKVPIFIADYVLANYGTGAIMAVPGHDDRDYEFAERFGVPVLRVIAPSLHEEPELPYVAKDGVLVNSGEYTGKTVADAQTELGEWIEALAIGERKIQYKLRDWLISRQRYWGCPIPVIHTKEGEEQLVPESQLPVELPMVDHYEPTDDGQSPLAQIPDFVNVTDLDGRLGRRETDTMGGFACSSWYFLRFCDPHNPNKGWDPAAVAYWMPVDCYVGGAEHAVMHLLYARFWTKVLFDAGLVPQAEPFAMLRNQGQVLALTPYRYPRKDEHLDVGDEGILISFEEAKTMSEDEVFYRWARMSKSKGNVVTPEEAVEAYGADALRMHLLFVAPFEADIEWKNEGMQGQVRFLSRIFKLVEELLKFYTPDWRTLITFEEMDDKARSIRRATHQAIRNVTTDIERFAFNTYVSWLQKYLNKLTDEMPKNAEPSRAQALAQSEALETLILLLSPGAPHSADELWSSIGKEGFTVEATWPKSDDALAAEDTLTIAVQINGKLRDTFEVAAGVDKAEYEKIALESAKVQVHLEGKEVKKVIVIPNRLVNIVVA